MQNQSRILIVDDTPANLEVVGRILSNEGYAIYVAESGADALALIPNIIPDLVLLDIMMPGMDGFEVSRHIQQGPYHNTPVLFLSALTDTKSIIEGFAAGGVDYIAKPCQPAEVLARVRNHLALAQAQADQQSLIHLISSNLTTPLRSIERIVQECDARNYSQVSEQVLDLAHNGLALLTISSELIDNQTPGLVCGQLELDGVLNDALALHQAELDQKQQRVQLPLDTQLEVHADYVALVNGVLGNVLSACITRSLPGDAIQIRAHDLEQTVKLEFYFGGPSFSPAEARQQLYPHVDQQPKDKNQGSRPTFDRSLAVARRFIHAMGGDIRITDSAALDSTRPKFILILPKAQPR